MQRIGSQVVEESRVPFKGVICGLWPNRLKKTAEWAVGEGLEGRENKDELLQELLVSVYCYNCWCRFWELCHLTFMECEPNTSLSNVDFPPIALRCRKCSRSRWKTDQSHSQSNHVWTESNSIGCTSESDHHAEALDCITKYSGSEVIPPGKNLHELVWYRHSFYQSDLWSDQIFGKRDGAKVYLRPLP